MKRYAAWSLVLLAMLVVGTLWREASPTRHHARSGSPRDAGDAGSTPVAARRLERGDAASGDASASPAIKRDLRMAQCDADYGASVRERVVRLGLMPDARAQLGHAMLGVVSWDGSSPADFEATARWQLQAIERAAAADPNDVLIAWLQAQHCAHRKECDAAAAFARLQALEPDNAAVWMMAIRPAWQRGDHAEAEALLARAARAARYDDHEGDILHALVDVLDDLPLPPSCIAVRAALGLELGFRRPATSEDMAFVTALSVAMAVAIPGLTWPVCERAEQLHPRRRAACVAVHVRMVESDAMLAHAIGLRRLAEWTAGTPEGARWREGLRNYYWLQSRQLAALRAGEFNASALAEEGELVYWRARLEAEGRWPAPPAWLPDNPEHRSLVLTGRRPPGS